jgi:anaerobic ribonucleoside-triphosphate reductase activating protein
MELLLSLGSIRESTTAEGPGVRFAIWVQGCSIKCRGCFNPHLWNPKLGAKKSVSELIKQICAAREINPAIEGVTFLGGEPFEQAEPLTWIATRMKEIGLNIMIFTGYTLEELQNPSHKDFKIRKELLELTDLLVDGRFEEQNIDLNRPWVGSTNQRFHFLSNIYSPEIIFKSAKDRLEIKVSAQGLASINGWATTDKLEKLIENL